MGLFNSNKKNKNTKLPDREAINEMWKEAYRANPRVYENTEDKSILVGFALTEDTPSLFPLVPEKQWAIEGKTINSWIITMVSLTKPQGGIIGQMEYHEAMERLKPYIVAVVDNWALIRGMTHDELDGIFEGLPRGTVG